MSTEDRREELVACLPAELRGATVTPIRAGLSGAGVYRVADGERVYVLKVSAPGEPAETWRRIRDVQALAADADVAPRIVHADEARRAVVSEHLADRGLFGWLMSPPTRDAALAGLGDLLRRVHALPPPPGAPAAQPRALFATMLRGLEGFALPAFARDAAAAVLAEEPPPCALPDVLSHNDVNPSNLVFDGMRPRLLDWTTAALSDPYFDLATLCVFLRLDAPARARVLAAYGAPLSPRLDHDRRLVGAMCGTIFFHLARTNGHAGGELAREAAPTLATVYERMRAGQLSPASPEGQWAFGLALVRASLAVADDPS